MKRAVITGLGVVSPLGCELQQFWKNIQEGKEGIGELTKIDATKFEKTKAAEVKGFEALSESKDPELQNYGAAVSYAIAASRMAIEHSGLKQDDLRDASVLVGTTMGNQDIVERITAKYHLSEDSVLPDSAKEELTYFKPFHLGTTIARKFNMKGNVFVIPTACAAGNYSIGMASSLIKQGRSKIALAGGADPFSQTCYTIFNRLGANTPDICTPFDSNRKGMAVGEGAAIMVIEEYEHAVKRGAEIFAEIKGYGLSCDAYQATAPHPEGLGAVQSMNIALKNSEITSDDVGYISAHGTGTKANDSHEAVAMAKIFGEKLKNIPVSSVKSMLGHCMGAASAIEGIISALTIHEQKIAPTINTQTLDPEFPIEFDFVPTSRDHKLDYMVSNAFAFGGNVSSVVFGKV